MSNGVVLLKQNFWQRIIIEMILLLTGAVLIGFITGQFLFGVLSALTVLVGWNVYNLYQLANWIWQQNTLYPPHSIGSWEVVFYGLYKHRKRLRQRQNELAEIIKRFRHGSQSLPDALIITNNNGTIEWCSKIAQYQLNIRWPDDKGQNIINLVRHPEFANYMQKKQFSIPLTLFFNHKSHVEFRIIPYIDHHWLIIVRDVDLLYLAAKQRHDFFTNASHELRTPLTVLHGYVDMLSDGTVKPEKQSAVYQTMQNQIERMESLISQILTLSEIENSRQHTPLTKINMPDILTKIHENIQHLYPNNKVELSIQSDLWVKGYHEQLYSAVSNLIYNAIKHNPSHTQITLRWQKTDQGAYFSITDTGKGIAPYHIVRLTERFYQVDSVRTYNPQKNGSGLGLAIVKHALLNHGNTKLEIESELGKGSHFFFTLPNQFVYINNK